LGTAQFDPGVRVHHQPGAIRNHGHRNGFGEITAEQANGDRDDAQHHQHRQQAHQWARDTRFHRLRSPIPTG
jgi:hypothetical protein